MFDNRWENWIGDFQDSFAASQLDPAVREYIPEILTSFGAAVRTRDPNFPDEVSSGTFVAVMSESMPRLKLPDEAREFVPDVIAAFLDSLEDSGRVGEGRDWGAQIRILATTAYQGRLAPDGGVKGVTIRRAAGVAPVGRNDPCPCGSGKKFKKCCLARGA